MLTLRRILYPLRSLIRFAVFMTLFVPFLVLALVARFRPKKYDVGLGPEPLINNVYHKRALERKGWTVQTYVVNLYNITDQFDVVPKAIHPFFAALYLAVHALFSYRILYIYFNGGPLAWTPLRVMEPYIYKLARVNVLVMPYGSDVQDMRVCPNFLYKQAVNREYREMAKASSQIARNISRWSKHADYIISGCDWVDYTYRWDQLCLAHFSIDTNTLEVPRNTEPKGQSDQVIILHAPNHKVLKGSEYFVKAIDELRHEGYAVELKLIQNVPNTEVRNLIAQADIIADQLVVGWYAMFAIEGMVAGKPVLCYLRDDLVTLYEAAGLIEPGELPLVNCTFHTVKDSIRNLLENRDQIDKIGSASRDFVVKHHSLEKIGEYFDVANRAMGHKPIMEKN